MSNSLNKAIIIGRLGKDPEIKSLSNGKEVANFSVATSESYTAKNGEKVETTEWHNVVVWNPHLIKIVGNYISKGALVYIEGEIKTRKWDDKNGTTHYNTEIVIENFGGEIRILSSKNETKPENNESKPEGNQEIRPDRPSSKTMVDDINDDQLPF